MQRTIDQEGESGLAVRDPDSGELIGNFSASDIRLIGKDWQLLLLPVREFLAKHSPASLSPLTCTPTSTVGDVIHRLAEHNVRRVWIVNDRKTPVGLVTTSDIMDVLRWFMWRSGAGSGSGPHRSPGLPALPSASPQLVAHSSLTLPGADSSLPGASPLFSGRTRSRSGADSTSNSAEESKAQESNKPTSNTGNTSTSGNTNVLVAIPAVTINNSSISIGDQ